MFNTFALLLYYLARIANNIAKTPMIIGVASIAVNAVACYLFMTWFAQIGVSPQYPNGLGHVGVALSTSLVALVNFFALAIFMRRKIQRLNGRIVLSSFVKIAVASAIMSIVCYFSYRYMTNYFGAKIFTIRLAEALIPIILGAVTFFIAAKILRIEELEKVYRAIARKLGVKKN